MRGVGGAVVVAFGFGLGLMGMAWAQPAPQPAGGSNQQTTRPDKIRDNPTPRRVTNAAAKKLFKAQKAKYDSLCKSKEEQDRAQAALDDAEYELAVAINREVYDAPEVKR